MTLPIWFPVLSALAAVAPQDPSDTQRIDELERRLEALALELEQTRLGEDVAPLDTYGFGFGPGGAKIYEKADEGVSIGGYGEWKFEARENRTDRYDALRTVIYVGYKFDQEWLVNAEFEFEHGTTDDSSATTSSGGSVSAEFAYLDYLYSDALSFRGGLLLSPMGFVNEIHEPTTFHPASRSQTESRIIPTTWREMGIGVHGRSDNLSYRAYMMNGLNGAEFDATGVRGGRQKGNRAAAADRAFVARVDWDAARGLSLGGSIYTGDSGQDGTNTGGSDLGTTIAELHAEYRTGGFNVRALHAQADIDDASTFNTATGNALAETLTGTYVEAGYDFQTSQGSLTPFLRWETINTQDKLPAGTAAGGGIDDDILTLGLAWRPLDNIVLKLDHELWDEGDDVTNFVIGYVF